METFSTIVRPFSTVKGPPPVASCGTGQPSNTLGWRAAGLAISIPRGAALPKADTRMTRVRFDPGFINDPRWERLGADAFILHSFACAYVVHTLSDGFVSEGRALTLTPLVRKPKQAVQVLLADGVWVAIDGGYVVCSCHEDLRTSAGRGDEQPSRGFVEGERERARKRQEQWRNKRNTRTNGASNRGTNGVTNAPQYSAEQCSAGTTVPVPAPALADNDAVCEHGTPGGLLPTRAGTPRCPACRRSSMALVEQDTA